jgi:hypothetical protein
MAEANKGKTLSIPKSRKFVGAIASRPRCGLSRYKRLSAAHDRIEKDRFTLIGLPLKMLGAEASPVRAVAVY